MQRDHAMPFMLTTAHVLQWSMAWSWCCKRPRCTVQGCTIIYVRDACRAGGQTCSSSCSFFIVMLCILQCGKIGIPQGYCRCNCDAETLCAWFRCLIANLHQLPQRSAICNPLAAAPRFSEFDTFLFVVQNEIGFGSGRATNSLLIIPSKQKAATHFHRLAKNETFRVYG